LSSSGDSGRIAKGVGKSDTLGIRDIANREGSGDYLSNANDSKTLANTGTVLPVNSIR